MEISNPHHQVMGSHSSQQQEQEDQVKRVRAQVPEQALKCPRCESTNTKFCYYNNYSLSQPRYFCKGCRRYWTKGGSLRNVPVGGGCRKNKRSSSSSSNSNNTTTSSTSSNNARKSEDLPPLPLPYTFATLQNQHTTMPIAPNGSFLDILNSTTPNGTYTSYYGFGSGNGSHEVVFPHFDGGGSSCTTEAVTTTATPMSSNTTGATTTTTTCCKGMEYGGDQNKMVMGIQWPFGAAVDHASLDYWNGGAVGSSWHGLINSSLM